MIESQADHRNGNQTMKDSPDMIINFHAFFKAGRLNQDNQQHIQKS